MISVVLATYNEEKNLKRCLDSVVDFANEIIVVDGSSTDNTREIAHQMGVKVIKTTNKPIFHINKQMAMDEAKHELVLQLDADEVVDDELRQFILEISEQILSSPEQVAESAWWVRRKNNYLGHWLKKGGQYPDPVIRLYRNGKARLPQKSVHEQMEVDGQIGWAKGHLLHYSNPQFKDHWRKMTAYAKLEAKYLLEKKQQITLLLVANLLLIKPWVTFFKIFIRHKGFVDGMFGFIFAIVSALLFPVTFIKYLQMR